MIMVQQNDAFLRKRLAVRRKLPGYLLPTGDGRYGVERQMRDHHMLDTPAMALGGDSGDVRVFSQADMGADRLDTFVRHESPQLGRIERRHGGYLRRGVTDLADFTHRLDDLFNAMCIVAQSIKLSRDDVFLCCHSWLPAG